MKKKILIIALILFGLTSFGQTINLGSLTTFEGYTGAGAITNAAGATWTGDAGTNFGIISGFDAPPSFVGNTYNADAVTDQVRYDLVKLYIHLNALFVDYPSTHTPAFGNVAPGGETITPGVYSIAAAGSIKGTLTLNGLGDPDAFFIIKFGAAMTVDADAVVNLTGGTQSCNVFFIAQNAISVAAKANLKGTLFSNSGAIDLGDAVVLEGRMLTFEGAITNGANATSSPPPGTSTIPIFCEPSCNPAADVLGILSSYSLYTSLGAVENTGTSKIIGNIGTDLGAISGFGPSIVNGSYHSSDASTTQANIDLNNAYNSLMAMPNTVLTHAANFGSVAPGGDTINAGVYFINGVGSLGGTLVLNGQNNADAMFVFKFADAFSVAAQSKMILINGANRCNVFFIGGASAVPGAINIGADAVLQGTFLSNGGACGSGASVLLSGRLLSIGGSVTTSSGTIYNNAECVTSAALPIELLSFTGEYYNQSVVLEWITATEINNDYFEVLRSTNGMSYEVLETIDGGGNSTAMLAYDFTDSNPADGTNYYMLRQTDYDGQFEEYGPEVVHVLNAVDESMCVLTVYPNPCPGNCRAKLSECSTGSSEIRLMMTDATGHIINEIYAIRDYDGSFDIQIDTSNNLKPGLYIITTVLGEEKISEKLMVG
jgi:hypothetical protein